MSEADRVARRRAEQKAREAEDERQHRESERLTGAAELEATIRQETDQVLTLLVSADYPDVEEIEFGRSRRVLWWRSTTYYRKAAWRIGSYAAGSGSEPIRKNIYLVSDGRLAFGHGGRSSTVQLDFDFHTFCRDVAFLNTIVAGLRELRSRVQREVGNQDSV